MRNVWNICAGLVCIAVLLLTAAGCKTRDAYQDERARLAALHFERAKWSMYASDHVYTLDECIDLALKYNLDIEVAKLEEKSASEATIAEALGMLPELTASDTVSNRNNVAASGSLAVASEGSTYSYSTSQDQFQHNLNIDLALSFLDFGLAAFNTAQANDRTLIREQRTRRVAQNLQADVVRAYFQVAAAQKAIEIATDLLEKCKTRYELIREMGKKKLISPFRAFDETKRFFEMEKRLTNYTRNYEASRAELRALLGLTTGAGILVDTSMLDEENPPDFALPDIHIMEQIALLERPELFEIDMQRHINVFELYKTIIMMFPNVRIYMDFSQSSNSFLYHHTWMELAVRAAYNLLKLPQQIARAKSIHTQIRTEESRGFAQAVGIVAQVRIADVNLQNAIDRFRLDNRIYHAYSENLRNAEASIRTSGGLSQLELDHIRLSTAETRIERLNSLGGYYIAYYRLLNSIGIDKRSLDSSDPYVEACRKRFAQAQADAEEEIREAWDAAKKQEWAELPAAAPRFRQVESSPSAWTRFCRWSYETFGFPVPDEGEDEVMPADILIPVPDGTGASPSAAAAPEPAPSAGSAHKPGSSAASEPDKTKPSPSAAAAPEPDKTKASPAAGAAPVGKYPAKRDGVTVVCPDEDSTEPVRITVSLNQ